MAWTTTDADSVSIDNGVGTVAVDGNLTVTPTAATTYTLTATGAGGTATASVTVTVDPAPAPEPPVLSLTITAPTSVNRGDRFAVGVTIANDGGSAASGLTATLSWTPSGNLRLRRSSAAQSVATISADGGSASVNWTLRAKRRGTVTLTVAVSMGSGTVVERSVSMQVNK